MNVLVNGEFNPCVESTNGFSYSCKAIPLKNGNKIILDIWDTPGQENYPSFNKLFFGNVDCFVLGYDITLKGSFENIDGYWYPLSKQNSYSNLFYLIGNKADLFEDEEVSDLETKEYAKNNNMRFFLISCKDSSGIKEFLDDLTNELIKN